MKRHNTQAKSEGKIRERGLRESFQGYEQTHAEAVDVQLEVVGREKKGKREGRRDANKALDTTNQ